MYPPVALQPVMENGFVVRLMSSQSAVSGMCLNFCVMSSALISHCLMHLL
jgi:hypothetical protein